MIHIMIFQELLSLTSGMQMDNSSKVYSKYLGLPYFLNICLYIKSYNISSSIYPPKSASFPKAKWSSTEKIMFGRGSILPGPQSYDANKISVQSARCTIGKSSKDDNPDFNPRSKTPGPNIYNPNPNVYKKRSVKTFFGTNKRMTDKWSNCISQHYNISD
jgi:hypothetical protein